jgi:RHS repeat-associated protein
MVIIPIAGDGDCYKLLAQAIGYAAPELDNGIDTNTLNAGHFQLLSGDFNGDGLADVFIQSTSQSLLSLTLANSLVEDAPYILQSFASFGIDTHKIVIEDLDADGRDDITYTVNNQSHTLHATNQGHLTNDGQAQVTANYGYDYLNKRRYKVVEQIGEPRKEVLYIDDNTELRDGKLQKYITLGGQKVARSSQSSGEFSPTEFYLNNHLGSIALTLDARAHVKNAFTYEPYGDKQVAYGGTQASPYGFTGKEQDPETQLGYFHHRYLNTQIGQFITPDPVFAMGERFTDPQLWSPYVYGRNNPIVYVDPDGQVVRLFTTLAKFTYKAGKQFYRNGKIDSAGLKKGVMDELVGIADDINTLVGDGTLIDKFGAVVDLTTGLETTDGDIREFSDLVGKKGSGKKWDVGQYNNLKKTSGGTGLDSHHAGQQAFMKKLVSGYDPKTGPAILVPRNGHTRKDPLTGKRLSTREPKGFENPRDLLARDIKELRRVYDDVPNNALNKLIDLNKTMYPGEFKKKSKK